MLRILIEGLVAEIKAFSRFRPSQAFTLSLTVARGGTISSCGSISISIFSKISFSISRSISILSLKNKYNYVGLNPAALINYLSNFSNIFKHQIQTSLNLKNVVHSFVPCSVLMQL